VSEIFLNCRVESPGTRVAAEAFQALPFVSRVVERRMALALWAEAIRGACLLPGSA